MAKDPLKDHLKKFGANIKKMREAKGLSLREMASLCDLDYSYIGRIERGELNISIATILQLAEALEVKPKRLMEWE